FEGDNFFESIGGGISRMFGGGGSKKVVEQCRFFPWWRPNSDNEGSYGNQSGASIIVSGNMSQEPVVTIEELPFPVSENLIYELTPLANSTYTPHVRFKRHGLYYQIIGAWDDSGVSFGLGGTSGFAGSSGLQTEVVSTVNDNFLWDISTLRSDENVIEIRHKLFGLIFHPRLDVLRFDLATVSPSNSSQYRLRVIRAVNDRQNENQANVGGAETDANIANKPLEVLYGKDNFLLKNADYSRVPRSLIISNFSGNNSNGARQPVVYWDKVAKVLTRIDPSSKRITELRQRVEFPEVTNELFGSMFDIYSWLVANGVDANLIGGDKHLEITYQNDLGELLSCRKPATTQTLQTGNFVKLSATEVRSRITDLYAPSSIGYRGLAVEIPATIDASRYDWGSEGIAYHDTSVENERGYLRPQEGVDLANTDGLVLQTHIRKGEWQQYSIAVKEGDYYDLTVRYKLRAGEPDAKIHLYLGDMDLGEYTLTTTNDAIGSYTVPIPRFLNASTDDPSTLYRLRVEQVTGGNWLGIYSYIFTTRAPREINTQAGVGSRNLALGRPVTASGATDGKDPALVTDGDQTGNWTDNEAFVTNRQQGAWIDIDLGQLSKVESVVIHNIDQGRKDRWKSYRVIVSDRPLPPDLNGYNEIPNCVIAVQIRGKRAITNDDAVRLPAVLSALIDIMNHYGFDFTQLA
ncbi:MAG: discoidin domain-containing protein, partial [Bacteroidota bacterium]